MKLQFKYDYIKYERSIVYLSLLFSKLHVLKGPEGKLI